MKKKATSTTWLFRLIRLYAAIHDPVLTTTVMAPLWFCSCLRFLHMLNSSKRKWNANPHVPAPGSRLQDRSHLLASGCGGEGCLIQVADAFEVINADRE